MIVALMNGSSNSSIWLGSGSLVGLSMYSTSPLVVVTRYTTVGVVLMSSNPYSRSSRSWMISMWSNPRNPQRKPKPSASDVSGSYTKLASFSRSFSSASRKRSEEHTSELQSRVDLVCRLLLEKKTHHEK